MKKEGSIIKVIASVLFVALVGVSCNARRDKMPDSSVLAPETTSNSAESNPTTSDSVKQPAQNTTHNANAAADLSIIHRQVGPIKINMPITVLKEVIPANRLQAVAITKEGKGYNAYEIKTSATDAQAGLLVEEICEPTCRVWRIQVLDSAYKTPAGLGIGATLGEVKKHYPISYLGAGETEIVAVSERAKITFMLDVSKLSPKQVPFLSLKNTPDSVRVLGMFIF